MAASLRREIGLGAEVVKGRPGEFSVRVDGAEVIRKRLFGFLPSEARVVEAVRKATGR